MSISGLGPPNPFSPPLNAPTPSSSNLGALPEPKKDGLSSESIAGIVLVSVGGIAVLGGISAPETPEEKIVADFGRALFIFGFEAESLEHENENSNTYSLEFKSKLADLRIALTAAKSHVSQDAEATIEELERAVNSENLKRVKELCNKLKTVKGLAKGLAREGDICTAGKSVAIFRNTVDVNLVEEINEKAEAYLKKSKPYVDQSAQRSIDRFAQARRAKETAGMGRSALALAKRPAFNRYYNREMIELKALRVKNPISANVSFEESKPAKTPTGDREVLFGGRK